MKNRIEKFKSNKEFKNIKVVYTKYYEKVYISHLKYAYGYMYRLCSPNSTNFKEFDSEIYYHIEKSHIFVVNIESYTKRNDYATSLIRQLITRTKELMSKKIKCEISEHDLKFSPFLIDFYKSLGFVYKPIENPKTSIIGIAEFCV